MKPKIVDVQLLDGIVFDGLEFEIQAAMTVRDDPLPLEGVERSKIRLPRAEAIKLAGWLMNALQAKG